MVVVPAGSFRMGSRKNEKGRDGNEGPLHPVTIGRPFAVGRFEVTVDQFAAFVKDSGYDTGTTCDVWQDGKWTERPGRSWRDPGFPQSSAHPAACVSWDDAKAYAALLSRMTGKPYRLPSEAEWEYAARAGTATRYHFGDDENDLCCHGNGGDQKARRDIAGADSWTVLPCSDGHAYTAPVASFPANGFGLHDVHGNVWEWTEDCWHDSYTGAPSDGSAWTRRLQDPRVARRVLGLSAGLSAFGVARNAGRGLPLRQRGDSGRHDARTLRFRSAAAVIPRPAAPCGRQLRPCGGRQDGRRIGDRASADRPSDAPA
jgi:formylglycine-generating enzyme required for sulfatase activity